MVVIHLKLGSVEKSTCVQTIRRNKIPPFLAAVGKVEAAVDRTKSAVGGRDIAVWLSYPEARSRRDVNHQAGLVSVFGRRRPFNHLHRLDRVGRYLIRKDIALLIRDRLAIQGKRVGCMIPEAVKQTVRISRNARGGQRDQRTQRRRLAFERQFIKERSI